ncbi:MAG TPA: potassium channel protein [Thermoplasmata archaeon]|nr:potassium channel protein [Thermoplasmata archaeon]
MKSLRVSYASRLLSRLWIFLAGYAAVYLTATFGFYYLESYHGYPDVLTAAYWAMVTLSTIGYGDVVPTTPDARLFVIGIAATEVFLGAYLVSIVISVVAEESQHRLLGTFGTDLKDHIVVLGYAAVGSAVVRELIAQDEKVAVVAETPEQVALLHTLASDRKLFATTGPPGDATILKRVNIESAHSVVVCTGDDTTTLIAALNARAMNPTIRIVVSVGRPELKQTLKAAGVTYVASPAEMAGRLCADAAFRPEVANMVEDLTTTEFGADMEEFVLTQWTPISRQTLPEAEALVRKASDCLVIGYARPGPDGEFRTILNPPMSFQFQPGDALIVVGTLANLHRLQQWIGVPQGR